MLSYYIVASYRANGRQRFGMVVHHAGKEDEAKAALESAGWDVKSVTPATADHLAKAPTYDARFQKRVDAAVIKQRNQKGIGRRQDQAKRREVQERAARVAAESFDAQAEARQMAIMSAVADIVDANIERGLRDSDVVPRFCSNCEMFFDPASPSKREAFTAASLDFSDLEAENKIPTALEVMRTILTEMNKFLEVDAALTDLTKRPASDRTPVETPANPAGSRTLLLNWLAGNSTALADQTAAQPPAQKHRARPRQPETASRRLQLKQELSEFRAKTAISVLLAACGKVREIDLSMSADLERFVSGKG